MHEEKTAESEVERSAGHGIELEHIGFDELELGTALGAEVGERLAPQLAVDLDAGDAALLSDAIGHQPHDRTRPRAHVEAAHARPKADPVEHLFGRPPPHHRLIAQTLVLVHVPVMHVTVRIQI